jgi:hypothetical protein
MPGRVRNLRYDKNFWQVCQVINKIKKYYLNSIFFSLNKINFGGTKGNYYEMQFRRINNCFNEIMNSIKTSRVYMLNITEVKWFQDMAVFRYKIGELEMIMKNLLNNLFEDIVNVEMGIETLHTLYKFKGRSSFDNILCNKWTQVNVQTMLIYPQNNTNYKKTIIIFKIFANIIYLIIL